MNSIKNKSVRLNTPLRRSLTAALSAAGILLASSPVGANTINWTGSTDTTWATGINWTGGTAPTNDLTTDIALFDLATYTNQPNAGTTSINGIQIGDGTTATGALTLSGTALTIGSSGISMLANAGAATISSPITLGAAQTWSNNSSNLLTVSGTVANGGFLLTSGGSGNTTASGVISGTGGLTKTGSGTLTLSGANSFTGNITINNGTLATALGLGNPGGNASQTSGLGDIGTGVSRSITVNNGGTLSLTGGNVFGTGGSSNTLSGLTLNVNQGGVFQTGLDGSGAGWWNKIGAVNLDGGTIHVGSGANTSSFQGLALIGTVTVGGSSTTASTIDNLASSNSASNGVHLGQNGGGGQAITFNVADVTGNSASDLNVSVSLRNTSSNQTASGLTKAGAGTMTLSGSNVYTGTTTVSAGTLVLGGANGALTSAGGTAQLNGGTFLLDNTGAGINNNNRLADTQAIALNGGGFLFKGSDQAATNSTETVGALTGTGNSKATVTFGGTNTATLTAASFGHSAGNGSTLVNGVNLGMDSTSTASVGRFIVTAAPTLTGTTAALTTGINSASKNTQIVPFLLGEATSTTGGTGTATGTANTFVTYAAGSGLRPLNLTDEFTNNAITAGNNTYITSATTASSTASINSLIINGGDLSIDDAQTLTNTSGALLFTSSNAIKPSGTTGALTFGAEGMVAVNSGLTGTISAKITGTNHLTKSGAGTLTLSAVNTYTGATFVAAGTLNLTGTINSGTTNGVVVGNTGSNAVLKINSGATLTANDLTIGSASGAAGAVYQSGGAVSLQRGANVIDFRIGGGNTGAYGYYGMSGGTLTSNEIGIGGNGGGNGLMEVSGGTFTDAGWLTMARGGGSQIGVLNISGTGSVISNGGNGLQASFGGTSIINVQGGSLTINPNVASVFSGGTGILNVNGGTVSTRAGFAGSSGVSLVNFNGGTMKALGDNTLVASSLTGVYVQSGGGTIDNGGFASTIAAPLRAATGNGITSIAVTNGGSGYISAPLVTISGGTGNTATGYAVMVDDGTGNGTYKVGSIVITSPGTYTVDPTTVTLSGGGASTAATIGSITNAANTSGGMTFAGSGTTTLSGANTYTGGTTISAGTLSVSGSLADSGAVNVNGGTYDVATSDTVGAVTLTSGTISGVGTLTGSSYGVQSGTVSAVLGGSGALTKTTSGTVTLNAANTYSGNTTISGGTLALGGSGSISSSSAITVASGATFDVSAQSYTLGSSTAQTLRGAGSVTGGVSVASGSTVAAGVDASTIGTLTFSSTLTGASGVTFSLKLDSTAGSFDLLTASGAVTLGSATLALSDIGSGSWTGTTSAFSIVHGASIAGTFTGLADGSTVTVGSNSFTLNYTGTDVTLTAIAIPEPSTYAAMIGVLVFAGAAWNRRRSSVRA